jgi:hypothetical protein
MRSKWFASAVVLGAVGMGSGSAWAAACNVQDVTFSSTYPSNLMSATACSNALDGGGNTPNLTELANLWGAGFVEGVTIGNAGNGSATGGTVLGGFKFTLSGVAATTGGTYSLGIQDTNGLSLPNLPYSLDFVLYLKGGNADTSAYFFDNTQVDASGGGAWTITFLNGGGNNPALSNISLWVREGETGTPPSGSTPEPSSLALLGLGLIGLGVARRRSRCPK